MVKDAALDHIANRWTISDTKPSNGKIKNPVFWCNAEESRDKCTPPSPATAEGGHRLCRWSGTKARFPNHAISCSHALETCKVKCKEYCKQKQPAQGTVITVGNAVASSSAGAFLRVPSSGRMTRMTSSSR